jgi:hypothetical protein
MFLDSTGEAKSSSGEQTTCPLNVASIDHAPEDSVALRRLVTSKTIGSFAAGLYGVNVQVTTDRGVIGLWAGSVRLPLAQIP